MLTSYEIENIRRSAAMASSPLPRDQTDELLTEFGHVVREREKIVSLLSDLPESFGAVRTTLNELQRLIGANGRTHHPSAGF